MSQALVPGTPLSDALLKLSDLAQDLNSRLTAPAAPGRCWVCGALADSGEHRIKKSVLVSVFGAGPYLAGRELLLLRDGEPPLRVCSPGSRNLKYPHLLCQRCNNAVSQPHDKAFEQLHVWLFTNATRVLASRSVEFEEVFGKAADEQVAHLLRYYCKEIGCRLADAGRAVPMALSDAVQGGPVPRALTVAFAVNEELAVTGERLCGKRDMHGGQSLWQGPRYGYRAHLSWLTTFVGYRVSVEPEFGMCLEPSSRMVTLGSDVEPVFGTGG